MTSRFGALTADDATGSAGAAPLDPEEAATPPVASTPAPTTSDPMTPPVTGTGDGVAASNDSGGSDGCSLHPRSAGTRSNAAWLLLVLGLVLRRRATAVGMLQQPAARP